MIEASERPIETRAEKPDRLNLANMVYQARFLKEANALDLQPQNWEVYVKSKYDDELEHIQRFTPDGKVSVVTRDRGNVTYHEYSYDAALEFLNQDIITVEEPKQYRTYVTDFSLVHNPEMDPNLEADSLRTEFGRMHSEAGIDLQQEAIERAEEDRIRAEDEEIRKAIIQLRNDAMNADEEEELARARAEIEALGEEILVPALAEMPVEEVAPAPKEEVISVFTHGLPKGFVMGEPSFEDEAIERVLPWKDTVQDIEGVEVNTIFVKGGTKWDFEDAMREIEANRKPEPVVEEAVVSEIVPTLGEQDFLNWPHIEVVKPHANGNGNGHRDAEVHSAANVEAEIPEGCKLVEFKNGQKRLKRIKDGKFVGKYGLTKKEREVTVEEAVPVKVESNGHKNGNGHKEIVLVKSKRTVAPRERKPRAPRVEAAAQVVETETRAEIEIYALDPNKFNVVYPNREQLSRLDLLQKTQLENMIKNLRIGSDLPTIQDLIKNMFGIDVEIHAPLTVLAK